MKNCPVLKMTIQSKLKKLEDSHEVLSNCVLKNKDSVPSEFAKECDVLLSTISEAISKLKYQLDKVS